MDGWKTEEQWGQNKSRVVTWQVRWWR